MIDKSFDTVDFKLQEAEFHLRKMIEVKADLLEFRFYFSAFLASSRTITLAIQQFSHLDGFEKWYKPHQDSLRNNLRAKYFLDVRNSHLHGGNYPIQGFSQLNGKTSYHFRDATFDKEIIGIDDVATQSRLFLLKLISIVYDCYLTLGPQIDPHQYFTAENARKIGLSIEEAEVSMLGWTHEKIEGIRATKAERWDHLRSKCDGCQINHIFKGYLNKVTPQPKVPDDWSDFEYSDEDKGWIHIPAGYSSTADWQAYLSANSWATVDILHLS